MKESNWKYQQFPLLYSLSYLYLQFSLGLQAYFSNRLMESGNVLDHTHHVATDILNYTLDTTSTALAAADSRNQVQNTDPTASDIATIINTNESLPEWLLYPKVEGYVKSAQKQSLYRLLTFVSVVPHNPAKLKLLTSLYTNDYYTTQRNAIDLSFFSPVRVGGNSATATTAAAATASLDPFYSFVPDQLLYNRAEREEARATTFSLTNCIDKLSTNRTLTKYEIAMLAAINKTPARTIQQLNFPQNALGAATTTTTTPAATMTDSPSPSHPTESPFAHELVSPLLQHNVLTIAAFTTSISFSQLCTLFGLDPADHAHSMHDFIRDMIIHNILPHGQCKIDTVRSGGGSDLVSMRSDTVTFVGLKSNNLQRVQDTMGSRSRFLRLVYDSAIDGERYARQLNRTTGV